MKRTTVTLHMRTGERFDAVPGYAFDVDGVPLVAHRTPWYRGRGACWQVTEPRTGLSLATGLDSREDAVQRARARVERVGVAQLRQTIEAELAAREGDAA